MPIIFYPHEDELSTSTLEQKLEVLLDSAQRYKAIVLESGKAVENTSSVGQRLTSPKDLLNAYNWEEISRLLHQIRNLPENNPSAKQDKSAKFKKLAEIYEVLRAAKMPKLEAVRIALMNESNQLGSNSGGSQVA